MVTQSDAADQDPWEAAIKAAERCGIECSRNTIYEMVDAYLTAAKNPASDRIANAPKAWAIVSNKGEWDDKIQFDSEQARYRTSRLNETHPDDWTAIPIALVELTEEEAR